MVVGRYGVVMFCWRLSFVVVVEVAIVVRYSDNWP